MQNPRLGTRYAKSLIDLSVERGELEVVYKDMLYLQALTKGSKDFLNLLRSPVVKNDVKTKIVNTVTEGKISELTKVFTTLMINKGRESNLPEVAFAFVEQYKKIKDIHSVKLTTATEVSNEVKTAIVEQVKRTSNMQNIELEAIVDQNIIGGFVLQAGDKLVDASIAYDLKEIAKQFENNDFVYKVR
jgi:F-type H+-transporting ATPase subunit delta